MITVCAPPYIAQALRADPLPAVTVIDWPPAPSVEPAEVERVHLWVAPYPPPDVATWSNAISAMPRLTAVQLLSAGVDPWATMMPDGVLLCSGRGIHGVSTAELALALMLALLRDVPLFLKQQEQQHWRHASTDGLAGKQVLIIGAGEIGKTLASAVQVFGATATLVGRTARPGVRAMQDLDALVPEHDIVVVAVPHTPETRNLVDQRFLAAMPDGAILVNVARGQIVVTDDLVAELRSGRLRAALDVVDTEPLPSGHPLWTLPGVVITPHVGGGARGWQARARHLVRDQIGRLLAEEPLANVVSWDS